jgi:cobalt-precorrin 5A hydrolase/precorrin-3B C17-methyltransferase
MNTPLVEFVGAGPGAEDLITLRGLRALEQADLVVYAGSLVNPGHLKRCKTDCECRDSAAMNLGEQVAAMSEAALTGKRVVRLHTGDPAMYGAINEQIRALAEKGIASRIVPGVSSVFGAAAALGCELTCPKRRAHPHPRAHSHAQGRKRGGLRTDRSDAGLLPQYRKD